MSAAIERRLAILEAREALRELKTRYAAVCDSGFDPAEMAELFTDDAVLDAGAAGSWNGRQAIVDYYANVPRRIGWCMHHVSTSSLTVEDDLRRARGSWCFFEPATINGRAVWVMGRYVDEYRFTDRWQFSRIALTSEASTPFDAGWVKERFLGAPADDGASAGDDAEVTTLARAAGLRLDAERAVANTAERANLRPLLEPLLLAPVQAEPATTFGGARP